MKTNFTKIKISAECNMEEHVCKVYYLLSISMHMVIFFLLVS